jgi:hypothetical protein
MSEPIDETKDELEDEPMFDPIDESSDITWFEDPPSGPTPDWHRPGMTKIGVGRYGEVWVPIQLLSNHDQAILLFEGEPTVHDERGETYVRKSYLFGLLWYLRRRVRTEEQRQDDLKLVRARINRKNGH